MLPKCLQQGNIKLRLSPLHNQVIDLKITLSLKQTNKKNYTKILFSPIRLAKIIKFDNLKWCEGNRYSHTLLVPCMKSSLASGFQN